MNTYKIVTECTCDLSNDIINNFDLTIIPMEVVMDHRQFDHDEKFSQMSAKEFYDFLRNGSSSMTAQINPARYVSYFKPILSAGYDILYLCFSSGLSSTYQSAQVAKTMIKDSYPDRNIIIIDTLAASAGEGLLVYHALLNQQSGLSLEENKQWVEDNKLKLAQWFTVDDLQFLKRGGRISGTVATLGTALKIKPVLHVDNAGHLVNVSKSHGRKMSLVNLAEKLSDTIDNPRNQTIFISHADTLEDAEFLASKIKELVIVDKIVISDIGPVIGSHSGPGSIALFFIAKER